MDKIFQNRRSCRDFQDKEVNDSDLKEILEAAESAPSAGGLKARKILAIRDEAIKK